MQRKWLEGSMKLCLRIHSRICVRIRRAFRRSNHGQAMVEYLVIGLVLLVVIVVLAALAGRLEDGVFVDYAIKRASHSIAGNAWETIGDVLLY